MSTRTLAYWWVNHKQTFQHEVEGGYIWSPKRRKDGGFNQFYENMARVVPGDIVISYAGALIKAIGVATGPAQSQGKPFHGFGGDAGANWDDHNGWLVPIEWTRLPSPIRPKDHLAQIAPLLPSKYSPLQQNGDGNQACYLAEISSELGELILSLARHADEAATGRTEELARQLADEAAERVILESGIQPTEKEQLIKARQGQGIFRQRVMEVEPRCRVTKVGDERFLIASHIKPWRDSTNEERLDGANGLMLAPHVDRLFDKGWISFADDGKLLTAPAAADILAAWHIHPGLSVGRFTAGQRHYLAYHREHIFKETA